MSDIQLYQTQQITVFAKQFAASGLFADTKGEAQAFVKICAGHELGFAPFESMNGIHIIKGKTCVSAGMMASAIKASGKYDYRVTEHTETKCAVSICQNGEEIGVSQFSMEDARNAGLLGNDAWKKYARNMLFARAISNAVKWFCPDVFRTTVYTPEEMGAAVDEDGGVIDGTARIIDPPNSGKPAASSDAISFDDIAGIYEENHPGQRARTKQIDTVHEWFHSNLDRLGYEVGPDDLYYAKGSSPRLLESKPATLPDLPAGYSSGTDLDDDAVFKDECVKATGAEQAEAMRLLTNAAALYGVSKLTEFKGQDRHRLLVALKGEV